MNLPKYAFFQGRIVPYGEARLGVLTHALNYGTGCFAGLRGYWNEEERELFVFRPGDHFKRFLDSARLLTMQLSETAEELVGEARGALRADGLKTDCHIQPLAFWGDETIGVQLHGR